MNVRPRTVWVFHRGALGDSVILWPALRTMTAAGVRVTLVTDHEKGALAARELGIGSLGIEHPRFNQLWIPNGTVEPVPHVDLVFSFHADGRRGLWRDNARRAFPGARVRIINRRPDQRLIRPFIGRPGAPPQEPRLNPGGPIVVHVGAGSEPKRWPLDRWATLIAMLRARTHTVNVLAGEAEAERFSAVERRLFDDLGGRVLLTLPDLADVIRPARLYIGCDSGPTHLGAQLGVATLALFGPTCPRRWAPYGPLVRVLAPPVPGPITWLEAAAACDAALKLLGERAI